MRITDNALRIARIVTIAIVAAAIIFAGIVAIRSANKGPGHAAVSQPPSAKEVADSLHCSNFQDKFTKGGDPAVLDDGICWIGNQKYGIDTFASAVSRDAWLKLAEPLAGVVPSWETSTSVTYKSTGR